MRIRAKRNQKLAAGALLLLFLAASGGGHFSGGEKTPKGRGRLPKQTELVLSQVAASVKKKAL